MNQKEINTNIGYDGIDWNLGAVIILVKAQPEPHKNITYNKALIKTMTFIVFISYNGSAENI